MDRESVMVEVMEQLQSSSSMAMLPEKMPEMRQRDDESIKAEGKEEGYNDNNGDMGISWMIDDVSREDWKPRRSSFRLGSTHRLYEEMMLREVAEMGHVEEAEKESADSRKARQRTLATLPRSVYVVDSEEFYRDPWSRPTTLVRSIAREGGPVDPTEWGQEDEEERKERKDKERRRRIQEEEALKNGLSLLWRSIRKGERALERRKLREEKEANAAREREIQALRAKGLEDEEGEDIFEDAGRDYDIMEVGQEEAGEGDDFSVATGMIKEDVFSQPQALPPPPTTSSSLSSTQSSAQINKEINSSLLDQFLEDVEVKTEEDLRGSGSEATTRSPEDAWRQEDPFHLGLSHERRDQAKVKDEEPKKSKKNKGNEKRREQREWQAIERIMQSKYGHTMKEDGEEAEKE